MLDSCLFESRPDGARSGRRKKPFTLVMSTVVHTLIAGALILIPLVQSQAVPPVALPPPIQSPQSAGRIIKLAVAASSNRITTHSVNPLAPDALITPPAIPERVEYMRDAIDVGLMDNLHNGIATGGGSGAGNVLSTGILPPPVQPAAAAPPQPPSSPPLPPAPNFEPRNPIRISSSIVKSKLIRQVDPIYPSLARRAHVEGSVIVEAVIKETGTIDSLRIISGNPLLTQSVIDAVKQWRYAPTLLNGEPIAVITTITVNFTLN